MTNAIGLKIGQVHREIPRAWGIGKHMRHRWYYPTRSSRARILRLARSKKYQVFFAGKYFTIVRDLTRDKY